MGSQAGGARAARGPSRPVPAQDRALSPGLHRWVAAGLSWPPCSPVTSLPPATSSVWDKGHLHLRSQGLWGRVGERGRLAAVGGAGLAPLPEELALPAARWPLVNSRGVVTFAPYTGKGTRDNDLAALFTCDWVPSGPSLSVPAPHFQLAGWCVPSRPSGPISRKGPCVCGGEGAGVRPGETWVALEGISTAVVWNTGLKLPLTPTLVGGCCWGLTGPPQRGAGFMGTRKRRVSWASCQALCWAFGIHLKIPHTHVSRYCPHIYRGPEATWFA